MKSLLSTVRARAARFVKNFFYAPNPVEARTVLHWLASGPDEIPSSANAQAICEAIESQVLNKISHKDIAEMLYGLIQYRRTGLTPSHAHLAYVRAYEQTNGLAQELLHQALFRASADSFAELEASSFFKGVTSVEVSQWIDELNENGYCFLGDGLSAGDVDKLTRHISGIKFSPRGLNQWCLLDPENPPNCNVADAYEPDLKADKLIEELVNDPVLINIATAYLGAEACPLNYCLWYTFPADQPSSEAAQLFHYDLDTLRWLKIFIFLSDVGPENGPHEYVEGSHRPGTKPVELLRRDYARLSDADVNRYYAGRRKQLIAPKGSVVLADTRCFHKGVNPASGYRLVLQPIYAPSQLSYRQY